MFDDIVSYLDLVARPHTKDTISEVLGEVEVSEYDEGSCVHRRVHVAGVDALVHYFFWKDGSPRSCRVALPLGQVPAALVLDQALEFSRRFDGLTDVSSTNVADRADFFFRAWPARHAIYIVESAAQPDGPSSLVVWKGLFESEAATPVMEPLVHFLASQMNLEVRHFTQP